MSFGPSAADTAAQEAQQKYSANTEAALGMGREFLTGSAAAIGQQNNELAAFTQLLMNGGIRTAQPSMRVQYGGMTGGLTGGNQNNVNPYEALAQSAAEAAGTQYRGQSEGLSADLAARGLSQNSGAGLAALSQLNFQAGQAQDAARRQAVAQGAEFNQKQQGLNLQQYGIDTQYDTSLRGMDLQRDLALTTSILGSLGLQSQNLGGLLSAGGGIFGNALAGQGTNAANLQAAAAQNASGQGGFLGSIFGGLLNLIPVIGPMLGGLASNATKNAVGPIAPSLGSGGIMTAQPYVPSLAPGPGYSTPTPGLIR